MMIDFLPSLPTFAAFSVAALLLAVTPGPDMTLFLSATLSQGRKAGIASLLGASSGCLVHTLLAVLGISLLLATSPTAFWILKIVGATYLLWLAFQAVMKGSTLVVGDQESRPSSFLKNYVKGVGINILNPKVVIFFITFLPLFVEASDPAAWQKMLFLGIYFVCFSTPLMLLLILGADKLAATLKTQPLISRGIDWIFATVFGVFAVKILLTQSR